MSDTNPNNMFLQSVDEYEIAKISSINTKECVANIDIPIIFLKR